MIRFKTITLISIRTAAHDRCAVYGTRDNTRDGIMASTRHNVVNATGSYRVNMHYTRGFTPSNVLLMAITIANGAQDPEKRATIVRDSRRFHALIISITENGRNDANYDVKPGSRSRLVAANCAGMEIYSKRTRGTKSRTLRRSDLGARRTKARQSERAYKREFVS